MGNARLRAVSQYFCASGNHGSLREDIEARNIQTRQNFTIHVGCNLHRKPPATIQHPNTCIAASVVLASAVGFKPHQRLKTIITRVRPQLRLAVAETLHVVLRQIDAIPS